MKALLIAPIFFGYELTVKSGLEKRHYEVDFMDSEQLKPEYWSCWKKDFIHKVFRHTIPGQREKDRKKADAIFVTRYLDYYLNQIDQRKDAYSLVLTIKGDVIQDAFYDYLRKNNPNAKFILYLWDDVDPLHRRDFFSYFDKVYSYNVMDCNRFGWNYLPVFTQNSNYTPIRHPKEYDIAIIGTAHKERVKTVKRIYKKYKNKYSFYIYLLNKEGIKNDFYAKKKKLSYKEYMDILSRARAVLDNPAKRQTGPTTRVFDAFITKTKVLTTNKYIQNYPIYGDNIKIINERDVEIPENFIYSEYVEEDKYVPQISEWLESILAQPT